MRFGAAFAVMCVTAMTAPPAAAQVYGPPAPPPPEAKAAIDRTRDLVDPIRRCEPADDGSITVCGSDTERDRLTPELRAIAGVGRDASPKVPRVEANAMTLDRLPYNWVSFGGRAKPGPEYNPLYEMAKRATDPETGVPPPAEEEAP